MSMHICIHITVWKVGSSMYLHVLTILHGQLHLDISNVMAHKL